jgi:hypothetical protein
VFTDALKKSRDVFAYALLAVAALYVISGLTLLLNATNEMGLNFAGRAALSGALFAHLVLISSLVAAIALVCGFGEHSKNARVVVLIALAIAGLALLLALISWLASFGGNVNGQPFGVGVFGAGRIASVLVGLAHLVLLGLAVWFAVTVLKALPRTAPRSASTWGQPAGYGGSPGYVQPTWGQHQAGQAQQPQGWGQPPSPQGWPTGQPGGASASGATAPGWGDPYHAMPDYQGQPASAWGAAATGSTPPSETQPGWGTPGQPQQWGHGGPAAGQWQGAEGVPPATHQWGPAGTSSAPEPGGSTAADAEASRQQDRSEGADRAGTDEGEQPEQPERRSGWWQGPVQ